MQDLRNGATSDEVRELQERLRELGFFTYPESTGYFGSLTHEAVKAYQQARGIVPVSGYVGPLTRAELNKVQEQKNEEREVSLSAFIELLIKLGVIPADKAEQARAYATEA